MNAQERYSPRLIQSHPLLGLIPAFTLRRLIAQATLSEYPKGAIVVTEGQQCDAIYLLLSGRCEAQGLPIAYGPGDAIGVRELLHHDPHPATVEVRTHSVLLRIPAVGLERLFSARPAVAGRFCESLRAMRRSGHAPLAATHQPPPPRRIVALLAMSDPAAALREAHILAALSARLSGHRVLLLESAASTVPRAFPLRQWEPLTARCHGLNGDFCLRDWMEESRHGYPLLRLGFSGDAEEPFYVAPLLSHLGNHFDLVLLHLSAALLDTAARPALREAMTQCDLAYLFTPPRREEESRRFLNEMDRSTTGHIRLVSRSGAWTREARNRLVREICRQRVGIALSSGGAKGLAHIGVLQVMEEHGIEIDVIAGASMGAYIGAIYASGHDGPAMEAIAREVEGRWGWLSLIDPIFPPRRGFIRSRRAARRLRKVIGSVTFGHLVTPLRVMATELNSMSGVEIGSGEVATAVEASIAIPGICEPVQIGNSYYLDGGISDPLPVSSLVAMGIERIIAINAIPTPVQMRHFAEHGAASGRAGLFARYFNYFAHGNLFDTLLRSTDGMQMRVADLACRKADVALFAALAGGSWHDFGNPTKYIAHGRAVAEACLPALLGLTKGHQYEPRSSPDQPMVLSH